MTPMDLQRLMPKQAEESMAQLGLGVVLRWPMGTEVRSTVDDFSGTVQGYYMTREGRPGLVIQYHGKRFCHLYGEQWVVQEKRDVEA